MNTKHVAEELHMLHDGQEAILMVANLSDVPGLVDRMREQLPRWGVSIEGSGLRYQVEGRYGKRNMARFMQDDLRPAHVRFTARPSYRVIYLKPELTKTGDQQ